MNVCRELHDLFINYRSIVGRQLCDHLKKPVPKSQSEEYLKHVKCPIYLKDIQNRLKKEEYESFGQFDDDIQLLISNAKLYYQVYFNFKI